MNTDLLLQQLVDRSMEQDAKLSALTTVVTTMIARAASETHDPEAYLMTLTAPISAMADAFDPEDEETGFVAEVLTSFAENLENGVRSRLRGR